MKEETKQFGKKTLENMGAHSLHDKYNDRIYWKNSFKSLVNIPNKVVLPNEIYAQMKVFDHNMSTYFRKSIPYIKKRIEEGGIDIHNDSPEDLLEGLINTISTHMKYESVDEDGHPLKKLNKSLGFGEHIDLSLCMQHGIGDCDKYARILYMMRQHIKISTDRKDIQNIYMVPSYFGGRMDITHARVSIVVATPDKMYYTMEDPTRRDKETNKQKIHIDDQVITTQHISKDRNVRVAECYMMALEYGPAATYFLKTMTNSKDQKTITYAKKRYDLCIQRLQYNQRQALKKNKK